ncbi:glycerophosphodiester phosphodiesterase family protein [Siphonobacter sp. SORGH_AS_0500]|uniref:glycerophosphodiester phosphodiesterase family protein n=1 Tax=Siphonobacter sp. SORGH_AS_0500 TaxID=1864824 RepID=UPI00285C0B67|nr:glycerophosphodiester phosphodiesterase family protein [Siphonobacter sp. SORGH_AS_0500]MDR6197680.1 glycerophosphoryl diester phosphodiesterase [Siphonobacter sp. SORGH_AS_0500]
MFRISLLLLACGLTFFAQAQHRPAQAIIREFHDPNSKEVLVVAHRGDWRYAPENSVLSLQHAIELGVDVVEIDLKKSKDGVLILLHDQTLDRTTTGHGNPSDYTWEELQKFTLKNEHGGPTRQKIMAFEDCMQRAKGKVMINIDKGYEYYQEAYEILEKTGTVDHAIIKTNKTYEEVKRENGPLLQSKLAFMPIVNLAKPEAKSIIETYEKQLKPVAYELNFNSDQVLEKSNYLSIPKSGSKIWFNSLWASQNAGHDDEKSVEEKDPEAGWGWLIKHGAKLIQTDRPKELIDYLKKKGLHP